MDIPGSRWVEIRIDALRHNYKLIQKIVGDCFVCPVVKANGYGLGAVDVARVFTEEGALMLAVTTVNEGIELREAGIPAPILVMAPFLEEEASLLVRYRLTGTVVRREQLEALEEAYTGSRIAVHLKVETGLGRSGIDLQDFPELVAWMREREDLFEVEGVYSVLADASKIRYTDRQIDRFRAYLEVLEREGVRVSYRHLANSLATLERPGTHFDMVRVGTALYGQLPPKARNRLPLKNPWQVKARVISSSKIPGESSVGYDLDHVTRKTERVAVIPLGWADGLGVVARRRPRWLVHFFWDALIQAAKRVLGRDVEYVIIRGKRYFFVGRSAMGLSTILVDERVQVGDIAYVTMRRVTTDSRLPRVYLEDDRVIRITGPGVE